MILIENIDKIIGNIVEKAEQEKMREDFFDFAKKGEVNFFNKTQKLCKKGEELKNSKNYAKYDGESKQYLKLQKDFFEKLYENGVNFCCYCGNDRLTHFETKDKNFKRLYDIEHFLPRSKFPDLSVNLYNWLPVCISCNQRLKSDKNPLDAKEIFHPYFGFLNSAGQQRASALGKSFDENYSFKSNKKELIFNSEHSKFFKLGEIYLHSQDTFNIFNFIQDKRTKMKDEKMRFKNSSKTDEELKNYFFKNYYPENEEDILKFSNGKFKKDLIENIEF